MARNSRELARTGVDPVDEPSAEWGWHGDFPRGKMIAGWLSVGALLIMLIGNHQGRTEDIWLIGTAIVIVAALVWGTIKSRNSWRR